MLFPMPILEAMKIVGMITYGNYFDMPDNIHTI